MIEVPNLVKPNYTYRAKLLRVIDGDTIDVMIDVGFYTFIRKRLRFLEVDTYELRGGTPETKVLALQAKEFVIKSIESAEEMYIQTEMDSTGKYGRLLSWVWLKNSDKKYSCLNLELHTKGFHEEK